MKNRYIYDVENLEVYDGDTIRVTLSKDVGLSVPKIIFKKQSLRLFGINTPEIRGDEREKGLTCKNHLELFLLGFDRRDIKVQTLKDKSGKYGRLLAKIIIDSPSFESKTVNQWLVDQGLAKIYFGRGDQHRFPDTEPYPLEKK